MLARLSLAAALVATIAVAALASGGSVAPAQAAIGSSCGAGPSASTARTVPLAGGGEFDLAKWLLDKAGAAGAEHGALMAFDFISRITGLDKIGPETSEMRIMKRLEGIEERLADVTARIDRLTGTVGQLISEVRQGQLDSELRVLCTIANEQQLLFRQRFVPLVRAGLELGAILSGPNPGRADVKGPGGFSPRERVRTLGTRFVNFYDNNSLALQTGIADLHAALVPNAPRLSVLAIYGKVLMSKRFLNTDDSEKLLALYTEFAEVRALATWMAAEFWASQPESPEVLTEVLDTYVATTARERANLPQRIPPGVVVDLGSTSAETTDGKPMWFPPTGQDLGWLPSNKLSQGFGTISVDEVDKELRSLNDPGKDDRQDLGKGWRAPTKTQFTALISDECFADPANPDKFKPGVACKNAVGKDTGTNVAGYLLRLNPDDRTWQQLFCQSGPRLSCAPGAGPGDAGAPPHAFVWTDEAQSQRLECGYEILGATFARRYMTYTGFRTLATGPVQEIFPHLPQHAPLYQAQNEEKSFYACDSFFIAQVNGNPKASSPTPRNPFLEGALLATRFAGDEDRTTVDYMAQPSRRSLRLACNGELPTIVGTRRDDNLSGTPGRDVINAGTGDDVVRGLGGRDVLCGGPGDDLLLGGEGNDRLLGQGGDDIVRGGAGKDALKGGRGTDTLSR